MVNLSVGVEASARVCEVFGVSAEVDAMPPKSLLATALSLMSAVSNPTTATTTSTTTNTTNPKSSTTTTTTTTNPSVVDRPTLTTTAPKTTDGKRGTSQTTVPQQTTSSTTTVGASISDLLEGMVDMGASMPTSAGAVMNSSVRSFTEMLTVETQLETERKAQDAAFLNRTTEAQLDERPLGNLVNDMLRVRTLPRRCVLTCYLHADSQFDTPLTKRSAHEYIQDLEQQQAKGENCDVTDVVRYSWEWREHCARSESGLCLE